MAAVKVTITLPEIVADFVDELAARRRQPRSTVVADLLEEKRRQLLEEELTQAYVETAEDCREFARLALPLQREVIMAYAPYVLTAPEGAERG